MGSLVTTAKKQRWKQLGREATAGVTSTSQLRSARRTRAEALPAPALCQVAFSSCRSQLGQCTRGWPWMPRGEGPWEGPSSSGRVELVRRPPFHPCER